MIKVNGRTYIFDGSSQVEWGFLNLSLKGEVIHHIDLYSFDKAKPFDCDSKLIRILYGL